MERVIRPVFASQYAVDPEAVQTRFMDYDKRVKLPQPNLSLPAQFEKANEQAGNVAAGNGVSLKASGMTVTTLSPEKIVKFREKTKAVADKFAASVNPDLLKALNEIIARCVRQSNAQRGGSPASVLFRNLECAARSKDLTSP